MDKALGFLFTVPAHAAAGMKLAIARDLQRIWSDVLQEPLPTGLRRLIDRLEQVTGGKSAPG